MDTDHQKRRYYCPLVFTSQTTKVQNEGSGRCTTFNKNKIIIIITDHKYMKKTLPKDTNYFHYAISPWHILKQKDDGGYTISTWHILKL